MRDFISNNRLLLGVYGALVLIACFFLWMYEKNALHLFVNQYVGNRYVNGFFFVFDHVGDGIVAPLLIACITAVNVRAGIYATASLLLASLISTIMKYYFFDDAHRPLFVFDNFVKHNLNLVPGIQVNIHNSFPSGHATQGFAILMSLGFCVRRHWHKVLAVLVASLGAFSRVYLSQHWLVDIVAGSIIGTSCSLLFYYVFVYRDLLPRLNKPIQALFSKKQS